MPCLICSRMWNGGSERRGVVFEGGRQVAVAPRGSGSGSGWVGDDPGSQIESNREKGPKCERRPALRHAHKKKARSGST